MFPDRIFELLVCHALDLGDIEAVSDHALETQEPNTFHRLPGIYYAGYAKQLVVHDHLYVKPSKHQ